MLDLCLKQIKSLQPSPQTTPQRLLFDLLFGNEYCIFLIEVLLYTDL